MEITNNVDFTRRDGMTDALTEVLRMGASGKPGAVQPLRMVEA